MESFELILLLGFVALFIAFYLLVRKVKGGLKFKLKIAVGLGLIVFIVFATPGFSGWKAIVILIAAHNIIENFKALKKTQSISS